MCLFTSVLLEQFCFRFCFFLPSFLFSQHLVGSSGNSGFFGILVCCSLFCEFLHFLHSSEILIHVGCYSILLAGLMDS